MMALPFVTTFLARFQFRYFMFSIITCLRLQLVRGWVGGYLHDF